MDKVRCPYCGTEMVYFERRTKGYGVMGYCLCRACESRAPRIDNIGIDAADMKAAARAAAMKRYVEPTEKVIRTCATCASYRPSEFTNRVFCAYHSEDGHDHEIYADDYCSYWERRPTDEERKAVRWEDD